MKAIAAGITVVCVLLLCSAVMAEPVVKPDEYVVKKGDCLWKIGKRFGIKWQEIAKVNGVKGPKYIIHPGQKIIIVIIIKKSQVKKTFLKQWKKVGGNPYKGTYQWAIENFGLPIKVKMQVKENIKKEKFKWLGRGLRNGQKLNQVVFGKNKIWNNVVCVWPKEQAYAAKDYGIREYHVVRVLKCGNWAWWKEKPIEILPVSIFPEPKKEEITFLDKFDFYLGAGNYESMHYDAKGDYLWAKIRYRPFQFEISDNLDLSLGIFGFRALGNGNDEDYDYDWEKFALGPTIKLVGRHWDADFDAGIGELQNKGSIDLYRNRQDDDIFLLSGHGNFYSRRDRGEKWLPKIEVNLEATLPYRSKQQHSWDGEPLIPDPFDNQVVELMFKQEIYDFELNDYWQLSPGLNFGFGHNSGQKRNFYQLGPVVTMTYFNEDIFSISFLNYKEELEGDGDQWHWISGWLSIDGIIRAIKASRSKKAIFEDIEIPDNWE